MDQAHIDRAQELEAEGIKPYELTKNGDFSSTRTYPFFTREVPSDNRVPAAGDTLLQLYSTNGEFKAIFPNVTIKSINGKADIFRGGLPLIGQCPPPTITRTSPETQVFAVYEVYGNKRRLELANFGLERDPDKGVFVITKGYYDIYRVVGRMDPGHTRNRLELEREDALERRYDDFLATGVSHTVPVIEQMLSHRPTSAEIEAMIEVPTYGYLARKHGLEYTPNSNTENFRLLRNEFWRANANIMKELSAVKPYFLGKSELSESLSGNPKFNRIAYGVGDIILGFYGETDAEFQMEIGQEATYKQHVVLKKGEFVFAINDKDIYPTIRICYHEIHISGIKGKVQIIWGYIEPEQRRRFVQMPHYLVADEFLALSGMACSIPADKKEFCARKGRTIATK